MKLHLTEKESFQKLTHFGLSEKEARVYVALLQLGSVEASKVAEKAELNRSTTYVVIDTLIKRGFVQASRRGTIQLFTASDPEILTRIAEAEKLKYTSLIEMGQKLIPTLKSMTTVPSNTSNEPVVAIHQNLEGVQSVYSQILEYRGTITALITSEVSLLPLNKTTIAPTFNLFCTSKVSLALSTTPLHKRIIQLHIVPIKSGDFELFLFNDSVAIICPQTRFACVIKSSAIFEGLHSLLNTSDHTPAFVKNTRVALRSPSLSKKKKGVSKNEAVVTISKRFWKT